MPNRPSWSPRESLAGRLGLAVPAGTPVPEVARSVLDALAHRSGWLLAQGVRNLALSHIRW